MKDTTTLHDIFREANSRYAIENARMTGEMLGRLASRVGVDSSQWPKAVRVTKDLRIEPIDSVE